MEDRRRGLRCGCVVVVVDEVEAAGIGDVDGDMGSGEEDVAGDSGGVVEVAGEGARQCKWNTSLPSPTNSDSVKWSPQAAQVRQS